MDCVW